jgi:monothiol glutaredoxin
MSEHPVFDRIKQEVAETPVVLFMKGTPVFPQCGFSATCVQVLSNLGIPFKGINVLEDSEVREGIKAFSEWPTIPQLYVKGEFVGGCDIIREMYETGELSEYFNTNGIEVQLANPQ